MPKQCAALAYELFVCDECEGYGRLGKLDKDAKMGQICICKSFYIWNGSKEIRTDCTFARIKL